MSFHFACRQPPVKRCNIESCLHLCVTGAGPTRFFPYTKDRTVATCDAIGVPRTPLHPLKNLCLLMVWNVMCCWWRVTHYSLSEIRMLKIGRSRTSLGCGTAYQLLPRSPTSKIHGLSWKLLSHAPPGVQRSSTTSPRVWRGCHRGGLLLIGIACGTVTPLVTGGRDTHTFLVSI